MPHAPSGLTSNQPLLLTGKQGKDFWDFLQLSSWYSQAQPKWEGYQAAVLASGLKLGYLELMLLPVDDDGGDLLVHEYQDGAEESRDGGS